MTMQNNIDIVRRNFRRNVDKPKLQTFALKIDNQRPILSPIAIAADNGQPRTNRFEIERDRRFANVAQVPDLVRLARKLDNLRRQFVMRIRQDEDLHSTDSRTTDTTGTKIAISQFRRDLCGLCARS